MSILLFITPAELVEQTAIGGNVDPDKYTISVLNAQIQVIEPLLGTELYDKIVADKTADTLAGDYLTLFTDYVQPITKNQAVAEYVGIASLMLNNEGVSKHLSDTSIQAEESEIEKLSKMYSNVAQMYINRFLKWICKNPLDEYNLTQDEVNASKDVTTRAGWYMSGVVPFNENDLEI